MAGGRRVLGVYWGNVCDVREAGGGG